MPLKENLTHVVIDPGLQETVLLRNNEAHGRPLGLQGNPAREYIADGHTR